MKLRNKFSTLQTVLLGLAFLLVAPLANALQLIAIDNPSCPYCIQFKAEVGQSGYDASEWAAKAPMIFIIVGENAPPAPPWFREAYTAGRIDPIRYTPTFILLDDDNTEISRFIGYSGREWFFENVKKIIEKSQ